MYPSSLFEKYKPKGVLVDTNLMVLLTIGMYDQRRILSFKRTLKYTLDDFALMMRVIHYFQRRITTPNILTEVDNLTRQLPAAEHRSAARALHGLVSQLFELYTPSTDAMRSPNFTLLGLTDSVTISSDADVLVVTDDFLLSNTLSKTGRDVVNINHVRPLAWT